MQSKVDTESLQGAAGSCREDTQNGYARRDLGIEPWMRAGNRIKSNRIPSRSSCIVISTFQIVACTKSLGAASQQSRTACLSVLQHHYQEREHHIDEWWREK